MLKRILITLLLLAVAGSLCGCKKNPQEVADSSIASENTTTTTSSPPIAQEEYDYDEIQEPYGGTTSFDPKTGTLTVKGTGKLTYVPENHVGIKRIVICEGVTEISYSFWGRGIEAIEFPKSLKVISNSFKDLDSLENLVIPDTVERISFDSFSGCAIKNLLFKGAIEIDEAFHDMDNLKTLVIPENSVCTASFRFCDNLKEVVIEKNVELNEGWHRESEDDDPLVDNPIIHEYNFQHGAQTHPKAYLYMPTDGADDPWGKDGRYKPILVPEGKSWTAYRYTPMEHR